MGRPASPKISKQCKGCGAPFEVPHSRAQAQFCGVGCRNRAGANAVRKDWRCPCGTELPPRNESHAIYCSPECRAMYGKKRQRDEAKWVTRTCLNCQGEFELRTSSQSWGKYCSNACAMRHTKTKQHLVMKEGDILLDSSYEALVWSALKVAKVPVERFDRQHGVEWGDGRWYAPDLWLSGQQIAVEVKGVQDDEDTARWDAYRSTGVSLAVLDRVDLMSMSPETALAIVENAAY